MSTRATHIYQHDSTIPSLEISSNLFLEGEKVEPIGTAIALPSHSEIEVVERLRVFW